MKKTFQKTLIAAAAGVAMMSAMGSASANSLLFPYFTTATGATSILSLSMGTTAGVGTTTGIETIHYVYNYGTACTHYDGNGRMTANDVMQHSVADPAVGGFGKVQGTDTSLPFYFPLKDYGFLTVSTKTSPTAMISGEMIVYDPANGIAVSLPGVSNNLVDTTTATGGTNEGNFNWLNLTDWNLTTYPSNLVNTSWYAVVTGNMNPNIVANADWNGRMVFNNRGVVYDNDETPYSGTATPAVKCSGFLNQASLMTTAQAAAIGTRASLTHVNAAGAAGAASLNAVAGTGAYMVKLQVIPMAGYPNSKIGLMHLEQSSAWLPQGVVMVP